MFACVSVCLCLCVGACFYLFVVICACVHVRACLCARANGKQNDIVFFPVKLNPITNWFFYIENILFKF